MEHNNNLAHLQQITLELRKLLQQEREQQQQQESTYKQLALFTSSPQKQIETEMKPFSACGAYVTKAGHLLFYTIL